MATESDGPLSISLDTDDAVTQVPVIADGKWVTLRLVSINQGNVEGKGAVVKFAWELTETAPDTDGRPIEPGAFGSKFFETVQLYDKNTGPGQPAPKWAVDKISKRMDALLNTGDKNNAAGKPVRPKLTGEVVGIMQGKVAKAKMKVKTGEYSGNEIAEILHQDDWAKKYSA